MTGLFTYGTAHLPETTHTHIYIYTYMDIYMEWSGFKIAIVQVLVTMNKWEVCLGSSYAISLAVMV